MSKKKQVDTPFSENKDAFAEALDQLESGAALSPRSKAITLKVMAIFSQIGSRTMAYVEELESEIKSLQFGTRAQRVLLLMDATRLPLIADPDIREKVLDRIHAALKSKPPDPPPQLSNPNALVHDGKVLNIPEKFADIDL